MSPKSLLLPLCLSFFCLSIALLTGISRLSLAEFLPYQDAAQVSFALEQSFAPAALPVEAVLLAGSDRPSAELVALRSPHQQWGIWSRALQRTRQLLWMLTRQSQTLRQGTQLA